MISYRDKCNGRNKVIECEREGLIIQKMTFKLDLNKEKKLVIWQAGGKDYGREISKHSGPEPGLSLSCLTDRKPEWQVFGDVYGVCIWPFEVYNQYSLYTGWGDISGDNLSNEKEINCV